MRLSRWNLLDLHPNYSRLSETKFTVVQWPHLLKALVFLMLFLELVLYLWKSQLSWKLNWCDNILLMALYANMARCSALLRFKDFYLSLLRALVAEEYIGWSLTILAALLCRICKSFINVFISPVPPANILIVYKWQYKTFNFSTI
jgi:hypothetical protein